MRTKEFRWDIDVNKKNLMGTVWELDGKSSPHPFKKIRNIPWEHVCATQLAHPFKKLRNNGAPHMIILTCWSGT
jgi:hypothetical protein